MSINHIRRCAAMGAALTITAVGLLAGPANPAAAKTIKVCVNKKSGEIRMTKKCAKGWKKKSWQANGPQGASGPQGLPGAQGPAGPALSVKDKNGTVIGQYMGMSYVGPDAEIFVSINGGWYEYGSNGRLYSTNTVSYTNNTCTSAPYLYDYQSDDLQYWLPNVGGPSRVVDRYTSPTWGPASAFSLTSSVVPVGVVTPLYYKGSAGCVYNFDADPGDSLLTLSPVTAPADFAGPLSVG